VLWGTFADRLVTSHAGVHEYFSGAFARKLSASVLMVTVHAQNAGNVAICSGSYIVQTPTPGGTVTTQARFSLVVSAEGGAWRIVNHHSSLTPTTRPTASGA